MTHDLEFWDESACLHEWVGLFDSSRISIPMLLLPEEARSAAERVQGKRMYQRMRSLWWYSVCADQPQYVCAIIMTFW